jgi:hypothetical protein
MAEPADAFEGLPGAEWIREGLRDQAAGRETVPALLVAIGAPRLRLAGVAVPASPYDRPEPDVSPEHHLYLRLAGEDQDSAHSRYNALVRRLVSFERALACAR